MPKLPRRSLAVGITAIVAALLPSAAATSADEAQQGRWLPPFEEPTIDGTATEDNCVDEAQPHGDEHDGKKVSCKPAAGSIAILGGKTSDVVYWDAIEDTEEIEASVVGEFGAVSINDQTRRLHLDGAAGPQWSNPTPIDAGANPDGYETDPALPPPLSSTETYNDGALFCSSLTFLPNGKLLAAGGTAYYHDPAIASKFGVSELEGMANSRIYDPATNTWSQSGDMTYGRWYPSTVPLADGKVFVASGVKRLVKTGYPDAVVDDPDADPADALTDSMRNVIDTETYDPSTGQWTENPDTADRSLPLFPRLHLLPNGHVYFNAAGQVFNPDGQAYDELLWNRTATYDPATQSWTDLAIPGLDTTAPGFRGSTFSVMLPLHPGEDGRYSKADFLTAGGIVGTTRGTYFAVRDSRIDTVDTTTGTPVATSAATGQLAQPRWYSTGVLTPTGEVIAFSGASADEVVGPGTAIPVTSPELFNPETGTWTTLASAAESRTYHNTAALLPDGRILVGGHAPIPTLYGAHRTLVPGTTSPNEGRNPTLEIFEPPYLFRGDRPAITRAMSATRHGSTLNVDLDIPGSAVESVALMRKTAITHLVDGGQRAVELPILKRLKQRVVVQIPSEASVLPAGPYLLFVNRTTDDGPVPSVARDLTVKPARISVTTPTVRNAIAEPNKRPTLLAKPPVDLEGAGAVAVDPDVAFHEIGELSLTGHTHALAGGHDHSTRSHGVPWQALPAAALAIAGALLLRATGRRSPVGSSSSSQRAGQLTTAAQRWSVAPWSSSPDLRCR